jgi:hypothetical protein
MLSPALTFRPSEPDSENLTVISAEACWFWIMTLTRLIGVTAWSRIVEVDVPTVKVAWVKPRINGDVKEMLAILVSLNHINFAELTLLSEELIVL